MFAGFYPGKNVHFLEEADRLGALLAARDIIVVYGRGTSGLMGRVAASAYLVKVKVLGVIPKPLAEMPFVGPTIGDDLRVSNFQDRIISMLHNYDAFIALPEVLVPWKNFSMLSLGRNPMFITNSWGY
ncbi:hypothetical protein OROMI_034677 [Orobanche minor]